MKLQGNSTTAATSRIKLQDKCTTPSTSTINLSTSADHSIGDFISQNEMGGFSNVLVTLDKSGNIIQCQPLSCEDGHLTSSEIVKVQKKNSTEQSSPDYLQDLTQSVRVDLTNLEPIGKELSSTEYIDDATQGIESTSNQDKNSPSICVDPNQLEEKSKENIKQQYDAVIDRNESTENTRVTSLENEKNHVAPCEEGTLKTTCNEEKVVKGVVHEEDNIQHKKIESNFQRTLDKLRQKLNARSKKENPNKGISVDKEQRKNDHLFGEDYKRLDEDVSELETTDQEIIGEYKFSADDEYEFTQDEEKDIDHEEVVETTISNNKDILKKRHEDNLFDLFLNRNGFEDTKTNEEKDTTSNGKREEENCGFSVQHVPIRTDPKNS